MKLFYIITTCMFTNLMANEEKVSELWQKEYEQIIIEFSNSIESVRDNKSAETTARKIESLNNRLKILKQLWLLSDKMNLISDFDKAHVVNQNNEFFTKEFKNYLKVYRKFLETYQADKNLTIILQQTLKIYQDVGKDIEAIIDESAKELKNAK